MVQLKPGKGHELHTHPESDEFLFVIAGEGEQTVAGETREVAAGEIIFISEGVEHGTVNTAREPLKLLAVYAPPGSEQQLAEMPECEVLPPGELPTRDG